MSFEFTNFTAATLTSLTPRTEKHGDEEVFAVSFGLKITGQNTLLDKLSPTLRQALYRAVDEATDTLPGVEQSTPKLRATGIEMITLKGALNGWTIAIEEDDPIALGDSKIDAFKVHPMEGGSVDLFFRVGTNDIDAAEAGALCSKLHQEIKFKLTAPKVAGDAPVIDGTVAAFKADHPDADATDLFAAGAGPEEESGEEDEGSRPDADRDEVSHHTMPDVQPAVLTKRKPVSAKYHDHATGQTWSGRGVRPAWIRAALAAGRSLEDFSVA